MSPRLAICGKYITPTDNGTLFKGDNLAKIVCHDVSKKSEGLFGRGRL